MVLESGIGTLFLVVLLVFLGTRGSAVRAR
jgi:hypothetical protein